jgi:ATP synthase protein I
MSDAPDPKRLDDLQAKIDALKGRDNDVPKVEEHYSQAQHAWRMVIELVSGLGIGFVIGYGIDWMLGTLPIFLVIFTMLGFVAGVKTMIRTANELQEGNILGLQGPAEKPRSQDLDKKEDA